MVEVLGPSAVDLRRSGAGGGRPLVTLEIAQAVLGAVHGLRDADNLSRAAGVEERPVLARRGRPGGGAGREVAGVAATRETRGSRGRWGVGDGAADADRRRGGVVELHVRPPRVGHRPPRDVLAAGLPAVTTAGRSSDCTTAGPAGCGSANLAVDWPSMSTGLRCASPPAGVRTVTRTPELAGSRGSCRLPEPAWRGADAVACDTPFGVSRRAETTPGPGKSASVATAPGAMLELFDTVSAPGIGGFGSAVPAPLSMAMTSVARSVGSKVQTPVASAKTR